MIRISKKQRAALKEIDELTSQVKTNRILGIGAIFVMVVIIMLFNGLGYSMGVFDADNPVIRGMMYITAIVIAAFSGMKLMKASRQQRSIDAIRQQLGISREVLDSWKRGEIE